MKYEKLLCNLFVVYSYTYVYSPQWYNELRVPVLHCDSSHCVSQPLMAVLISLTLYGSSVSDHGPVGVHSRLEVTHYMNDFLSIYS